GAGGGPEGGADVHVSDARRAGAVHRGAGAGAAAGPDNAGGGEGRAAGRAGGGPGGERRGAGVPLRRGAVERGEGAGHARGGTGRVRGEVLVTGDGKFLGNRWGKVYRLARGDGVCERPGAR